MACVRRATGPLLAAWLVATCGAVWVAWFSVHPVAELGFGKRPPVPRPEVAESPLYDSNDPSESLSRHLVRHPPADRPRNGSRPGASHSTTLDGPAVTPKSSGSPLASSATPTPVTSTPVTSSPASDALYQEATAEGGTATFEYTPDGYVNLLDVRPNPGWEVVAYRYSRDWVEVEFCTLGHRSIMVAYLDRGLARVYTIEQEIP
jgi:hypothetical protein